MWILRVAPFAGAWIEINHIHLGFFVVHVAPFAGAWIEILVASSLSVLPWSLPSRERGLKYRIESYNPIFNCRSLRGSVD